jgi:hypothetical protein
VPTQFSLNQNYPNPFNPTTVIGYQVPVRSHVSLIIFDALGRNIATLVNETKSPGTYTVTWNASTLPSGVYFYRLRADEATQSKKLVLVK